MKTSVLSYIAQAALPATFEGIAKNRQFVITKKQINPSICGCSLYQYHGYINDLTDADYGKEGMFIPQHDEKYENHFDCYVWFYLCLRY